MKRKLLIIAVALCSVATVTAQSRKALRINEVMVQNDSSIVDEYGLRSGWIEIFNANFAPLDISSVYLSTDPKGKYLYPVPLGDEKTRIGKRQHVVFFTDGEPNRGTFHTNFVLDPEKDNWIGLFDADSSLIDYVVVPKLAPNTSFARNEDGVGKLPVALTNSKDFSSIPTTYKESDWKEFWSVRSGGDDYITPSSANKIKDTNDKIALFADKDAHGFYMALMAMAIVFGALLILCLAFQAINKIGAAVSRGNKAKSHGVDADHPDADAIEHDSGEEIAAICMALNQHLNAHDTENTVLTINKVKRAYSPWNSKIYGMRQLNR